MTIIKLLIFSDSHGEVGSMLDIVEQEKPDEIIHLGDHLRDAEALSFAVPEIPMSMVPGNCDGWNVRSSPLMLERAGWKLLIAHGHQWRVKSGPNAAFAAAREAGADILLYGHTHQAVFRQAGPLWVMNPGTVRFAPASYGVLELEERAVQGRIVPC